MLVADLHLCWPGSPVQETLIAFPQVAGWDLLPAREEVCGATFEKLA